MGLFFCFDFLRLTSHGKLVCNYNFKKKSAIYVYSPLKGLMAMLPSAGNINFISPVGNTFVYRCTFLLSLFNLSIY